MADAQTPKQNPPENQGPNQGSSQNPPERTAGDLLGDRRRKLTRLRDEFGLDPYGQRIDGLISLATAKARYDVDADQANEDDAEVDDRPLVKVAGRVMQHRVMGNLIFMSVRDSSGEDLQLAVSKKAVGQPAFSIAKMVDYGDVVAAEGPLAKTKTGEISLWAAKSDDEESGGFEFLTKSLALPPGKYHGLEDPETRYRKRYMDLYANPEVMAVFQTRSRLVKATRDFLFERDFLEVETPMMQSVPGGAAARPFVTHHNALDIDLFLRIAPELFLKRLLVGGMPRVFEINRNFRNEGISPKHNPEFTMLELYEAFGDLYSIMDLTESLIRHLAEGTIGAGQLEFGGETIDYASNFRRAKYLDLFEQANGFPGADHGRLLDKAKQLGLETGGKAHDLLLNEVWEETVEPMLIQPTFVIDYPRSLCPLTKPKPDEPELAERFELFIAGMEIANAYTELNDPDVQEQNFTQQVEGLDAEESTFRNVDHDFLEALKVGMPPAGGLGVGIDRLVMLMTNQRSIRDVILFPLLRPRSED